MSAAVSSVMKHGYDFYAGMRELNHQPSKVREEAGNYYAAVTASMFALYELQRAHKGRSASALLQEALLRALQTREAIASREEAWHRAQHFNLYIKQQTPALIESMLLTAAFNEHGDTRLIAAEPLTRHLPNYSYAIERIKLFVNEEHDWDGCGGLPASKAAAKQVHTFLAVVQREFIQVPSVTMGGDGSVAVIWTNDKYYISADFDGAEGYSFFVSKGDEFICDGVSPSERLDDSLSVYLGKYFTDDQYKNL
nr:hypothetical protein [uncultured Pseudomonas sp.]